MASGMQQSDDSSPLGPVLVHSDRPQLDTSRKLAIIADPHLATSGRGTWKLLHRSHERLSTALEFVRGERSGISPADAVVFAGDQSSDGRREEINAFERLLADLDCPWTAIPGNHDVPKTFDDHQGVPLPTLSRRFLGSADNAGDSAGEASGWYPYVLWVGDLRVVCLNTAAPPSADYRDTWGGAIGDEQMRRLEAILETNPSMPTIVVAHHNLAALPEHEMAPPWSLFPANDADALKSVLQTADVPLAVTGHHHVPAVRTHDALTEVMAPAVCSFLQAMVSLKIGPEGTTVRLVPLAGPSGIRESYWAAINGKPLGSEIAGLVAARLPVGADTSGDNSSSATSGYISY